MVTAVVEMGTLGAIRVRTKDSFIFFTLVFFLAWTQGKKSMFHKSNNKNNNDVFPFFTVHSVSEKAHRTCRQSTCSTAKDISSIFLGEVNSAVIFTLDKLSDKLFISAGKEKKTGKYRFERSWIGKRFWSKVVNVQNSAWRLHKPPLLRSIKIYYLERRSGEYIQMISETSRLHCKHLNYSSKAVIVSSCYCTLCQIWLHENQRHERSKFNLKHWAGGSDALSRGEGAPARRCLE